MTSLFKKPPAPQVVQAAPAPPPPPPPALIAEPPPAPPTIDEASRAQDTADRLRRRKGRRATQLVPDGFGSVGAGPGGGFKTTLGS